MSRALEVEDLNVWYRVEGGWLHAVRDLSLAVDGAERFGLVGESGCGKSTAVHALMGLLPPGTRLTGSVRIHGQDVFAGGEASLRAVRWREIAIVFQGALNSLNPVRTIGAQIREPITFHGVARGREADARVAELLELVGLPASTAQRFPHELSGGMRQRAVIAMALACRPGVLLADEPTTALDVIVQSQIVELLESLAGELGLALVLVTHDLNLVADACHRASVMYAGSIVETGTVQALYGTPLHPYTRMLFAATPNLASRRDILAIPGAPPPLDHPREGCSFRERCDAAVDECARVAPPLERHGEQRWVACHVARAHPRA